MNRFYFNRRCKLFGIFGFLLLICGIHCSHPSTMSSITTFAFRLKPGADLKKEIQALVVKENIEAGWISTCVGSLTQYNIRFANQPNGNSLQGYFEIVGLTGTVSINGSHVHIAVSDSTGKTIGGHLLDGNLVYTTAELVILSSSDHRFKREKDGTTPWEELQVEQKPR